MLKNHFFPSQKPDEKIIMLRRRHWLIAATIILKYGLFLLAPIILYFLINNVFTFVEIRLEQSLLAGPLLTLLLSLYYSLTWVLFWHAWIDYYLDVWIVTDKRIVNIKQKGLFSRSISEAKLYRIQDVQAEVHGLLPTFFHFGNVTIRTAGNETFAVFEQVPSPYETSREILKLVEYEKKHHDNNDDNKINTIKAGDPYHDSINNQIYHGA